VVLAVALIGVAGAANYMYEKASIKGVGYKNVEMIIQTQVGTSDKEVHTANLTLSLGTINLRLQISIYICKYYPTARSSLFSIWPLM
jgi:hypothetical protein